VYHKFFIFFPTENFVRHDLLVDSLTDKCRQCKLHVHVHAGLMISVHTVLAVHKFRDTHPWKGIAKQSGKVERKIKGPCTRALLLYNI